MSSQSPDHGVAEMLRLASDDLAPDVDRLVGGGIARGRSRQRRARIGTTVATLAVIGVVGALAAVVPRLGGPDSAREAEIATEPASPTPTATPEPPAPTATPTRLTVPAAQVPATVERVLALTGRISEPSTQVDEPGDKLVQFLVDGMAVDVGMQASGRPASTCQEDARRLGGSCEAEAGGGEMLAWGPTLADGVTCQGVVLDRYGFEVWATSCNAPTGKDSAPLAPSPPLSLDELRVVARTHVWFN